MRPENLAYENLILRRAAGNEEEWPEPETTQLYRELVRGAAQITGSLLGRSNAVLSAEIATRTLLNLARFRGRSSFSTWFYRIARNQIVRHLENAHRIAETPIETAPEPAQAPKTPLKYPANLSKDEKRLCDLVLAGYTHAEIGELTGRNKRRVLYEWQMLRKKLKCRLAF